MSDKTKVVLSFQHLATRFAPEGSQEGCRPCNPITGQEQTDDEAFTMNQTIFEANGKRHLPADADPNQKVQEVLRGDARVDAELDLDAQMALQRSRTIKHDP